MDLEMVQLAIGLISAIFIGAGIFYTAQQLKLLIKSHSDNHEWNRRNAAQNASLMYSQLIKGNELLDKHFNYVKSSEPIPIEIIIKEFNNESDLRAQLHRLLNYFDSLCRGVNHKLYDEKILKSAWDGVIMRTYDQFKPYLRWYRKNISEEGWSEMELLVNQWRHESLTRKVTPRRATGLDED